MQHKAFLSATFIFSLHSAMKYNEFNAKYLMDDAQGKLLISYK